MIPTDNSDLFTIEILKRDGSKVNLICKYPTYKEHKQILKTVKELQATGDEAEYLEKIDSIFFPFITNFSEVEDSLSPLEVLQFKENFLMEAMVSESEKKKLLLQSQASTSAQAEKPSAQ